MTKRFVSWNVNGIRSVEKKGFVDIAKQLNADILAIQETKANLDQLSDNIKNLPGYTLYWNSAEKKGYSGVCIYTRQIPLSVKMGFDNQLYDNEGRCITLEFDDYYFLALYFPNTQEHLKRMAYKLGFNNTFHDYVKQLCKRKTVIMCGDFNVAHKPIDLTHPEANRNNPGFSDQERAWMDSFINSGFVDTFRKFNTEPKNYTWWSYRSNARAKNIGWRIDYFFIDTKSQERVQKSYIYKSIMGSDHCPVGIEFE